MNIEFLVLESTGASANSSTVPTNFPPRFTINSLVIMRPLICPVSLIVRRSLQLISGSIVPDISADFTFITPSMRPFLVTLRFLALTLPSKKPSITTSPSLMMSPFTLATELITKKDMSSSSTSRLGDLTVFLSALGVGFSRDDIYDDLFSELAILMSLLLVT